MPKKVKGELTASDRIVKEVWVITDIDESTNEGYGAERCIFPFDERFNLTGFTFDTKESAEEVLKEAFREMFHLVSKKAKVQKAEVLIRIADDQEGG